MRLKFPHRKQIFSGQNMLLVLTLWIYIYILLMWCMYNSWITNNIRSEEYRGTEVSMGLIGLIPNLDSTIPEPRHLFHFYFRLQTVKGVATWRSCSMGITCFYKCTLKSPSLSTARAPHVWKSWVELKATPHVTSAFKRGTEVLVLNNCNLT